MIENRNKKEYDLETRTSAHAFSGISRNIRRNKGDMERGSRANSYFWKDYFKIK